MCVRVTISLSQFTSLCMYVNSLVLFVCQQSCTFCMSTVLYFLYISFLFHARKPKKHLPPFPENSNRLWRFSLNFPLRLKFSFKKGDQPRVTQLKASDNNQTFSLYRFFLYCIAVINLFVLLYIRLLIFCLILLLFFICCYSFLLI